MDQDSFRIETARFLLYPLADEQLLRASRDFSGVVSAMGFCTDTIGFWEVLQKRKIYRAKHSWVRRYPKAWLLSTIWFIIRKTDNRMVGELGFKGLTADRASLEIGYSTRPPFRNQGYMTEAVGALCRFAFAQTYFPVERVFALTRTDNPSSHRVLEKNGFVRSPEQGRYWKWECWKNGSIGRQGGIV